MKGNKSRKKEGNPGNPGPHETTDYCTRRAPSSFVPLREIEMYCFLRAQREDMDFNYGVNKEVKGRANKRGYICLRAVSLIPVHNLFNIDKDNYCPCTQFIYGLSVDNS